MPTATLSPVTSKMPDPCLDGKLDAILILENRTVFAFRKNYYIKIISSGIAPGYPRPIKQDWEGLPDDIDAAFSLKADYIYEEGGPDIALKRMKATEQRLFFFKGSLVYLYEGPSRKLAFGFPKKISSLFPGVPDDVDSAFVWSGGQIIIFTKGSFIKTYVDNNHITVKHELCSQY